MNFGAYESASRRGFADVLHQQAPIRENEIAIIDGERRDSILG
jgi:hypothetical protein